MTCRTPAGWLRWPFWNDAQRRLRTVWRMLATLLLLFLFGAAAHAARSRWFDVVAPPPVLPELLGTAALLLALWAAARLVDRRAFAEFGLRLDRRWWADAAFGLALGAALMTLIFGVHYAAGWVTLESAPAARDSGPAVRLALVAAVVGHVATGVIEELLMRGYGLKNIAEGLRGVVGRDVTAVLSALVATSALFGVLHGFNPGSSAAAVLNIVLAGLLLGLACAVTGQLALPIGLHIGWNFFEGSVYGFPVSGSHARFSLLRVSASGPEWITGGAFGPEAGALAALVMPLGAAAVMVWARAFRGSARIRGELARYSRSGKLSGVPAAPDEISPLSQDSERSPPLSC